MKKDIQPKLNNDCVVTCACGNTFTTISALSAISVDICSSCHPFFTGQRRFVDTERRIDKFNKKIEKAEEKKKAAEDIKTAKTARKEKASAKGQSNLSVKEILSHLKDEQETK